MPLREFRICRSDWIFFQHFFLYSTEEVQKSCGHIVKWLNSLVVEFVFFADVQQVNNE